MKVCQSLTNVANDSCDVIAQLQQKLAQLHQSYKDIEHFEDRENDIYSLFVQAEREKVAEELQKLDINELSIEVSGVVYHQALRSYQTYQSAAGTLWVLRSLYRNAGGKYIVPLELRAGIVEGYWSPKAAKQAAWTIAQLPPADVKKPTRPDGEYGAFNELSGVFPKNSANNGSRSSTLNLSRLFSRRISQYHLMP